MIIYRIYTCMYVYIYKYIYTYIYIYIHTNIDKTRYVQVGYNLIEVIGMRPDWTYAAHLILLSHLQPSLWCWCHQALAIEVAQKPPHFVKDVISAQKDRNVVPISHLWQHVFNISWITQKKTRIKNLPMITIKFVGIDVSIFWEMMETTIVTYIYIYMGIR